MTRAADHPVFLWVSGRSGRAHVPRRLDPTLSVCGKIRTKGRAEAPPKAQKCLMCERGAPIDLGGGRPTGMVNCRCKRCQALRAEGAAGERCMGLVEVLIGLVGSAAGEPSAPELERVDDVAAELLDVVEGLLERKRGSEVQPEEGIAGALVAAICRIGEETDAILVNVESPADDRAAPTARPTFLPLERAVRTVDELLRQILVARGLLQAPSEARS